MDGTKQADITIHEDIVSKGLEADEQKERERDEWVAYWRQRRDFYEKMLQVAAPMPPPLEDMTECADDEPYGLPLEVKRALWCMFAIIVILSIINAVLGHLYFSSLFQV